MEPCRPIWARVLAFVNHRPTMIFSTSSFCDDLRVHEVSRPSRIRHSPSRFRNSRFDVGRRLDRLSESLRHGRELGL